MQSIIQYPYLPSFSTITTNIYNGLRQLSKDNEGSKFMLLETDFKYNKYSFFMIKIINNKYSL